MTARKVIGCKRLDGGADCLVTLGCQGCANAIYEQAATPAATCGHVTCARREHLVAVLIKAALDGAKELDDLQSAAARDPHSGHLNEDESIRLHQIVVRIYDACEQLGEKIGISVDEEVAA